MTTDDLPAAADRSLVADHVRYRTWERLGAHLQSVDGTPGVHFAVWAPNATRIAVIGDFNDWDPARHPMQRQDEAGVWTCFVPQVGAGALYKYRVESSHRDYRADKADPYGFAAELRPRTASKVWDLDRYVWRDGEWMASRGRLRPRDGPMSIYEVHLGSWRRVPEEGGRWLTYRELALSLPNYVSDMGYTHVELLPVTEHPFDGSWGYQTIGYFAPTSRFGTPDDFMYLVDALHRRGIGVVLDWVPAHFPQDEHGLVYFDGTHLYEHADPRQGLHPEWNTSIFNYGRHEVRDFLVDSALFWIERYHVDALRVDAVTSMLRLDYGRGDGAWVPNRYGGPENLEAVEFLQSLNERVEAEHPGATVIAEESTAWPAVTHPTAVGGLGFGLKWNMGWMHDVLEYLARDPLYRRYAHRNITFGLVYAFSEKFVLPLSHDEVVYGKGSLLGRMPGDEWQRFASLRLLFGYLFGHPGKKLVFMGGEFGQWREWDHDRSLDWHLLHNPRHRALQRWVRDLNTLYRDEPALFELDADSAGFEWLDGDDQERSVVSFLRHGRDAGRSVLVVANFTPIPRHNYRVGVPTGGYWTEVLNGDAELYGGSGQGNLGGAEATPLPMHGKPYALSITLPPLAVLVFRSPAREAVA